MNNPISPTRSSCDKSPWRLLALGARTLLAGLTYSALCADIDKPKLVSPHQLPSHQRFLLKGSGDRYEKAGKERLILNGSLDSYNNGIKSGTAQVRLTIEFPDQGRIENLTSGERLNFDGAALQKNNGQANKQELDLMEAIVNDSTDGFFAGTLRRAAVRRQGTHFQTTEGASTFYCDLFDVYDTAKVRGTLQVSVKTYCFDSSSGLLRSVSYESNGIKVKTLLSDWTTVAGQLTPRAITRFENGRQTFGFTGLMVATSPTASDGLFTKP